MITLCPLVYTTEPKALAAEYESQGLVTITSGNRDHWFEMRGACGGIGIHLAQTPSTGVELALVTSDADATLQTLLEAGFDDAHIWDEAWARIVGLTTPEGRMLWISAAQDDFYGYEHQGARHGTAHVGVRLATRHRHWWTTLLATLGTQGHDSQWELPLQGGTITLVDAEPAVTLEWT